MKNVTNRTKIVQGNKKCASVAHYGIELPHLPFTKQDTLMIDESR